MAIFQPDNAALKKKNSSRPSPSEATVRTKNPIRIQEDANSRHSLANEGNSASFLPLPIIAPRGVKKHKETPN